MTGNVSQYHVYWSPGSLYHWITINWHWHGVDSMLNSLAEEYLCSFNIEGWLIKYKYVSMILLNNVAKEVLTHWPLGVLNESFDKQFSSYFHWLMADVSLMKFPSDECQLTPLMISQHWFRQWLDAVRHQAIAWANIDPDLCNHMASQGQNGVYKFLLSKTVICCLPLEISMLDHWFR